MTRTWKAFRLAWTRMALVMMTALAMGALAYGPFVPALDGHLLPVTSGIRILTSVPSGKGMVITFDYTKWRECEFLGASGMQDGQPVLVFPMGYTAGTRGLGHQRSREWFVETPLMDGLQIFFRHRCNWAWITTTRVL